MPPWSLVHLIALVCSGVAACALTGRNLDPEQWTEARTTHLTILSDLDELAVRTLAGDLERRLSALHAVTPLRRTEESAPVFIYALRDPARFRAFLPSNFDRRVTGFTQPGLEANHVFLLQASSPRFALLSYTGFMLGGSGGRVPEWLKTGFKEYVSTINATSDTIELGAVPATTFSLLRGRSKLPLERMLAVRSVSELADPAFSGFYGSSWLAVHFLYSAHQTSSEFQNRSKQVEAYLSLIDRGVPAPDALSQALGTDARALDRDLLRYLAADRFPLTTYAWQAPDTTPAVRALPRWEAAALLADALAAIAGDPDTPRPTQRREAERLYALSAAERPDHARAHAGLARLSREPEEAQPGFERALELAPADARIHAWYGDFLRSYVAMQPSPSTAQAHSLLRRSRELLLRAAELEPELPLAHASYGATHLLDDADPDAGIRALEEARRLLPSNSAVALDLAELYMRRSRTDDARALLVEVRDSAAGPSERRRALGLLTALMATR